MFNPEKIERLFEAFGRKRIMVVGDVMTDAYLFGKVDRISPEAPVPVVSVTRRTSRLGGAANVALNLHSLGAKPVLVSVIGDDVRGKEFVSMLNESNMPSHGILHSTNRITTTKFRIIGNNVQMLRVDEEITNEISSEEEALLIKTVERIIEDEQIDAIILQDYNKGVLTEKVIVSIVQLANSRSIPVAVDPKQKHFLSFHDVTLFKPNLKELKEGLNLPIEPSGIAEISEAVSLLQQQLNARMVLVTLSEKGILIRTATNDEMNEGKEHHFPAHVRRIADVSGAGDTVISVATLCLAAGVEVDLLAAIANLAGGLVCEEVGVVPVDKTKLKQELFKLSM